MKNSQQSMAIVESQQNLEPGMNAVPTYIAGIVAAAILLLPATGYPKTLSSGVEANTLIELYTSQGCSSCPPAERWLSQLKEGEELWQELIPVAFHVDYWNYLGWSDPYSKAEYSQRQRHYRSKNAISRVYTPGFVVNGREWRGWFSNRALPKAQGKPGDLTLVIKDNSIEAHFQPTYEINAPLTLNLVIMEMGVETEINRGENRGRTITQDFVVQHWFQKRSSSLNWVVEIPVSVSGEKNQYAIAAWITEEGKMTPIQSVGGPL